MYLRGRVDPFMWLIGIAFVIHIGALVYRAHWCYPEIPISSPKYLSPLILSLVADCLAGFGFFALIQSAAPDNATYGNVLDILALLTAGVIAGRFAFSHQEVASDERVLATCLSALLLLLYYLLFGAVAYYSGISKEVSSAPMVHLFIPAILTAVLLANTIHDHWDFLKRDE
jgi:hypothetical protein